MAENIGKGDNLSFCKKRFFEFHIVVVKTNDIFLESGDSTGQDRHASTT